MVNKKYLRRFILIYSKTRENDFYFMAMRSRKDKEEWIDLTKALNLESFPKFLKEFFPKKTILTAKLPKIGVAHIMKSVFCRVSDFPGKEKIKK